MLLVLSPGTSTQWIPPRWLFGGPQNCETSPARPVSWIHWFIDSVSSHYIRNSYILRINLTTSLKHPALIQAKFITLEQNQAHLGAVMKGLRNPRNGRRVFRGVDFGGILPGCPRRPWTLNFERCRCVHSFTPKKPGFHLVKVGQNSHISLRNYRKRYRNRPSPRGGRALDYTIAWKKIMLRKNSIHFLATAFTISHLYLGVGLHILNTTK